MAAIARGRLIKSLISNRSVRFSTLSGKRLINYSKLFVGKTELQPTAVTQVRFYEIKDVLQPSKNAARPGRKDYEERIMRALNTFDRFPKGKTLSMNTHFANDLGLDSLDHVELIVALETEFECEIPDDVAEKLMTPQQMLDYFCEKDKIPEKRTEYHQHGTEPGDFKIL